MKNTSGMKFKNWNCLFWSQSMCKYYFFKNRQIPSLWDIRNKLLQQCSLKKKKFWEQTRDCFMQGPIASLKSRVIFVIVNKRHLIMSHMIIDGTSKNGQIYEVIIDATAKNGCFSPFFRMESKNDSENDLWIYHAKVFNFVLIFSSGLQNFIHALIFFTRTCFISSPGRNTKILHLLHLRHC